MKRGLFILLTFLLIGTTSEARHRDCNVPRFTYGAEWSYSAAFYKGYHFYFIAPEGYRVDDRQNKSSYCSNGEAYLHAGYNIDGYWNLSIYAGYTGIGDYHPGIPVSLRATRYFGDPMADRWFVYTDLGSGISIKSRPQELLSARVGTGYRLSMSRYTKLDFIAAIRFMYTHPDIDYYGEFIDADSVSSNSGYIVSASLGIGITF